MRCDYIIGFAINSKLLEIAAPWRDQCEARRCKHKPFVRRIHQLPYKGREWSRQRKLVARIEATNLGTDARFIVTWDRPWDRHARRNDRCHHRTRTMKAAASAAEPFPQPPTRSQASQNSHPVNPADPLPQSPTCQI